MSYLVLVPDKVARECILKMTGTAFTITPSPDHDGLDVTISRLCPSISASVTKRKRKSLEKKVIIICFKTST